jgi:bacterial/archaeal transporter family-2 protein
VIALTQRPILLILAVTAGGLLPVQFAINSALSGSLSSLTATAAISYSVGTVALLIGLFVLTRGRLGLARLHGAPLWSLLGGFVGSAYVLGSVALTRTLGTALAVTLVIAAQTLTSMTLDHFGALGLPKRPFNRTRGAVVLLVVSALILQVV